MYIGEFIVEASGYQGTFKFRNVMQTHCFLAILDINGQLYLIGNVSPPSTVPEVCVEQTKFGTCLIRPITCLIRPITCPIDPADLTLTPSCHLTKVLLPIHAAVLETVVEGAV